MKDLPTQLKACKTNVEILQALAEHIAPFQDVESVNFDKKEHSFTMITLEFGKFTVSDVDFKNESTVLFSDGVIIDDIYTREVQCALFATAKMPKTKELRKTFNDRYKGNSILTHWTYQEVRSILMSYNLHFSRMSA